MLVQPTPKAQAPRQAAPVAAPAAPSASKPMATDSYRPKPVVAQAGGLSPNGRALVAGAAGAVVGAGLMATMTTILSGVFTGGLALPLIAGAAALGALSGGVGLYGWVKENHK